LDTLSVNEKRLAAGCGRLKAEMCSNSPTRNKDWTPAVFIAEASPYTTQANGTLGAIMSRTTAMLAVALAGALAATGALAQSKPVDKASQKFISSAIQGDMAEVDFGNLAQEKGQSDAIKQYGAMLVKDHGGHKTKAEQVARELGVTPPTGSGIGAKATYAKLKILSGASFDRSFAKSMVKDHQEDIKEYRQEATKNDAAGRLAKETLPVLQKHLQAAQSLEKQTASSR
jgi:putative membrane protein